MKTICSWALLALVCSVASARPVVIEETATLTNPDPTANRSFGRQVATNGEYALVLGERFDLPVPGSEDELRHRHALLYRRIAGQWQFQQVLRSHVRAWDGYNYPSLFAMKGNLAALELDGEIQAYRLGATGWQPAGQIGFATEDLEIDGERIVRTLGDCSWAARVMEPNGTGGWIGTGLPGQPRGCDDEHWGGPADIAGDRVIIGTPDVADLEDPGDPDLSKNGRWLLVSHGTRSCLRKASADSPARSLLRGEDAIVDARTGGYVYRIANLTQPVSRLRPADAYLQSRLPINRDTADGKERRPGLRERAEFRSRHAGHQRVSRERIRSRDLRPRRGAGAEGRRTPLRVVRCQRQRRDRQWRRDGLHLRAASLPDDTHAAPGQLRVWKRRRLEHARGIAVFSGGERCEPHLPAEQHRRRGSRPAQRYELDQPGNRSADHADGRSTATIDGSASSHASRTRRTTSMSRCAARAACNCGACAPESSAPSRPLRFPSPSIAATGFAWSPSAACTACT